MVDDASDSGTVETVITIPPSDERFTIVDVAERTEGWTLPTDAHITVSDGRTYVMLGAHAMADFRAQQAARDAKLREIANRPLARLIEHVRDGSVPIAWVVENAEGDAIAKAWRSAKWKQRRELLDLVLPKLSGRIMRTCDRIACEYLGPVSNWWTRADGKTWVTPWGKRTWNRVASRLCPDGPTMTECIEAARRKAKP